MTHRGEERTNGIRYRFNSSMVINFQGTKISSVTDSLLVREILRGWRKVFFIGPHPPSGTVPPPSGERGLFFESWILRLRLSAPLRMTGWEVCR